MEQGTGPKEGCDSEGSLHLSSLLLKDYGSQKRPTLVGEIHGALCPMGGTTCCQGRIVRTFPHDKEGRAENTWNGLELAAAPVLCLLCWCGWNEAVELDLGRRVGKRCIEDLVVCHCPTLIQICLI